jgi:hypothetical protein
MAADNDIGFSKGPNGTLDLAEQSIIIRHNHRLSNRKANGFQPDNQLVFSFIHFSFTGIKVISDLAEKLV